MITPDLTKITNDYDNFKKQCNNITQSKPYTVTSILNMNNIIVLIEKYKSNKNKLYLW